MTSTPLVIVGLSGGVDSAVAALLLQQQGFNVAAVFMKNWEEDDNDKYCHAAKDLADATDICDKLKIPLHTANFATEYWNLVFSNFLAEYTAGRTPNPDILCNKEIKFKVFLAYAKQLNANFIATGHYAQVLSNNGKFFLNKAKDLQKDQSYFLYTLTQEQLANTLFPLATYHKPQIRQLAKQAGFNNYQKKDSTGICFIGERKFKQFLQQYIPAQPGKIITTSQQVIGEHDGLMYYTIGQRQGLKIGGQKFTTNPWYVVDKDLKNNYLIVAPGNQAERLFAKKLIATKLHWIAGAPATTTTFQSKAKIRYRQIEQPCFVQLQQNNSCLVEFTTPQRAITPGQSIVFYEQDTCLGGGIIETVIKE